MPVTRLLIVLVLSLQLFSCSPKASEPLTVSGCEVIFEDEDVDIVAEPINKEFSFFQDLEARKRTANITNGNIVIDYVVDKEGIVAYSNIGSGSGDWEVDKKLEESVREMKFSPATKDGMAVCFKSEIKVRIPVPVTRTRRTSDGGWR